MPSWRAEGRGALLRAAAAEGVDLLVIGGGITGAGVLLDAASRGLRTLLVERDDFASGTSSRSSKMVHGGFRYLAEGQLRVTREACRERDRLVRQNPLLVQPLDFLLPVFRERGLPRWKVRAGLLVYRVLAGRGGSATRMVELAELARWSRDLAQEQLAGVGLYRDAQVDDARLVLESLRCARSLGGEALSRTELVALLRDAGGRVVGARVRDREDGAAYDLHAHVVVNAAGPWAERVRGLAGEQRSRLRPAKGVHLVVPRDRVHCDAAVAFPAADGRHVFMAPWGDCLLIGTTDEFSSELDDPRVHIEEVHYLLAAAQAAFPRASLTTNDIRAVYAGVRPLVAADDEDRPPSAVSREDHIEIDSSGLVSMTGGKLTTYRAMGERCVDRVLALLPQERRAGLRPSCSAALPLRDDQGADAAELEAELMGRFGLSQKRAEHLAQNRGVAALDLLSESPPALRVGLGRSRFTAAEIVWAFEHDCAVSLCDVLERRVRVALFAEGQGLPQLEQIAGIAAEVAGWSRDRREHECARYAEVVRARYQISLSAPAVNAA